MVIAGGNLIKKVLFPAEILPVVTVLTNMVQFLLGLPVLFGFLVAYGKLRPAAFLLPLPLLVQLVFTLGLSLFVAALTVHFRDVQSLLSHLVHLWFFASPVLYLYGVQEGWLRAFLRMNPMAHVLVSYQEMLFDGRFDHGPQLAATALVALVVFAGGAWFFDRLRDTLAEEV